MIAPVYGAGEVGAELLKLPVKGVFFTGSVATGRKVLINLLQKQGSKAMTNACSAISSLQVNQAVASRVIKVQLELGGKDATYVCEDANVKVSSTLPFILLPDYIFVHLRKGCS